MKRRPRSNTFSALVATETELDFKFHRQATNKIGGISDRAARFLRNYFQVDVRESEEVSRPPSTSDT